MWIPGQTNGVRRQDSCPWVIERAIAGGGARGCAWR